MKQEPVAWVRNKAMWCTGELLMKSIGAKTEIPLYTAPREWVGLTDDEIWECFTLDYVDFARAIEAKLREKNT